MGLALYQQVKAHALVLPPGSAEEAALVPDARVYRARHLRDVADQFCLAGAGASQAAPNNPDGWARMSHTPGPHWDGPTSYPDRHDQLTGLILKDAIESACF